VADCAVCPKPVSDNGYICHQCTAALANTLTELARVAEELAVTVARQDRITRPTISRPTAPAGPAPTEAPRPAGPACANGWCDHPTCRTIRAYWVRRPGVNLVARRPGPESALSPKALPVNLDAAAVRDATATTLHFWADLIVEHCGPVPAPPPRLVGPACPYGWCEHSTCHTVRTQPVDDPLAVVAKFVAAHLGWLRTHPQAPTAWADLGRCHDRATRAVDRPADQWYAGRCWEPLPGGTECQVDLYASPDQDTIRCPGCRATHRVADRRTWLLEKAREYQAPAADVARLVSAYATVISSDFHGMLRNWIKRRLIWPRGNDWSGRPLYRIGDVLDRIEQAATRRRAAGSAVA